MPKPRNAIIETAFAWSRFCRESGCRFDVETKAAESVAFTMAARGKTFALPTKLEGVKGAQRSLMQLQEALCIERWQMLSLFEDGDGIAALWHGAIIGRVRPKHLRWLRPLLDTGCILCYVSEITGGGEKGLYGCNIVLAGIGDALDVLINQPAALAA